MSKIEMSRGQVVASEGPVLARDLWCMKYFLNECTALALCVGLLIGLTLIYIVTEAVIERRETMQQCHVIEGKTQCSEVRIKPWQGVIRFREMGYFELEIDEARLERFFAPSKITTLKKRLQSEVEQMRSGLFQQRKSLLAELGGFMTDRLSQENYLGVLREKPLLTATVENADLEEVLTWVREQKDKIAPEYMGLYNNYLSRLEAQRDREQQALIFLERQVLSLEPPLSFFWLYHPDYGWTFELIFWAWFGLLTNMIVALMEAAKKNSYSPRAFVMGFPKFYIAPFLSLIMVAVWMTGLSKAEIYYYNMPYFLLFSFVVGFSSERIPNIIRELSKRILGGMSWDDQKIKDLNRQEPFILSYQDLTLGDLPPATTLTKARKKAATLAMAAARKSLIKTVEKGDTDA